MQFIKRLLKNPEYQFYGLLFILAVLGYGLLIPQLGLYGDDPAFLSTFHRFGPASFQDYLGWFRPFAPWIYVLITPLFGEQVWLYHIFLLVLRWAAAVLFYKLLKMVSGNPLPLWAWAASLFILYPGFRQEAMPLEFCLHFATLCLYLASCILMILSIRQPRRYILYTVLAVLAGAGLFGIEYFSGLELLRPLMIGAVLGRLLPRGWLKRVVLYELPYLGLFAAYLVWRLFFLKTGYYQPTVAGDLLKKPLPVLAQLVSKAFHDLFVSGIQAWTYIYQLPGLGSSLWIYLGIALLAAAGVYCYFKWGVAQTIQASPLCSREKWGWCGLAAGLVMMAAAGLPLWSAGLPVELTYPWDRTTLPFMPGACLALASLIDVFFKPRYQAVVIAFLVAVLVGFQFQTQNTFRKEWDITSQYFWQLTWRAPQIKPGTLVLTDQLPFTYYSDNGLSPLLNWTYTPQATSANDRYEYFDLSARRAGYLANMGPDTRVEHGGFSGSTSQALVIYATPSTCLRLLTPGDETIPKLSQNLIDSIPLSRPELIDPNPPIPAVPPAFMGKEPPHTWCYYFAKAELAGQQGRWDEVVRLDKEAAAKSFSPSAASERIVFIKGYAHTGDTTRAVDLTRVALDQDPDIKPMLCAAWKNGLAGLKFNSPQQVDALMAGLKCP